MVHRPGLEHTRLTPTNAEELLFDDVIWVARAKAEHDMFVEVMRERGVEVFEAEQLLAEALAKPEAKDWVSSHILSERQVGITASRQAREWVQTAEPATVAEFLIGGMTRRIRRRCCCRRCRTSCSSATARAGSSTGSRSTR
jgi:arginine deiminase